MTVKSELTEKYLNEYRKKLKNVQQIKTVHKENENKYYQSSSNLNMAEAELTAMRRVISKMIDENIDPIEAQLSIDESDKFNIWNSSVDTMSPSMSIGLSSITTTPTIDLSGITVSSAINYDDDIYELPKNS